MLKYMRVNFELLTDIDMVHRTRYTRRFESMFQQIRASQQQVHAIVRSIEIIVISYVFRCKQLIGQCVNCFMLIFDGLMIYLILTLWISRWTPRQVTFSRLTWSIRNIFTMRTLTYRSVRRATNHPASGRANFSQLYTIRSATLS